MLNNLVSFQNWFELTACPCIAGVKFPSYLRPRPQGNAFKSSLRKKYSLPAVFILSVTMQLVIAQPKHEFRAAWVATVNNIDWPSKDNYNVDSQKTEYINILNMHRRNGMNAVIVQVRPATDAFFPSPYEPWSEWLTGKQGSPPSPWYDPLQFMIGETHRRGMEFHAWCNPYRAEFTIGLSSISPTHITRLHPEWFLTYGNKRYFDPGNKEAQQHVTNVIRDMVRRYDIDAVHFDDYFYPYRIAREVFPDDVSFAKYANGLNRDDWRRSNVDSVIVFLSRAIKEENKYCKFGISPFGVWRNNDKDPEGSATKGGQTNYDDLYADILLWTKKGWIDYIVPQLYWEFNHPLVAYETLIDWWSRHAYGRHLYIGHGIYRVYEQNNPRWQNPHELPDQIKKLREYPTVHGSVFFSSKSFINNPNGWSDSLASNYYKFPAIIPPMQWIDSIKPEKPIVDKQIDEGWKISVRQSEEARYFVLYQLSHGENAEIETGPILEIIPVVKGQAIFIDSQRADASGQRAVTVVSRNNIESEPAILK